MICKTKILLVSDNMKTNFFIYIFCIGLLIGNDCYYFGTYASTIISLEKHVIQANLFSIHALP